MANDSATHEDLIHTATTPHQRCMCVFVRVFTYMVWVFFPLPRHPTRRITAGPSAADGGADREHGLRGGVPVGGKGLPEALDGRGSTGGDQVRLQGLVV